MNGIIKPPQRRNSGRPSSRALRPRFPRARSEASRKRSCRTALILRATYRSRINTGTPQAPPKRLRPCAHPLYVPTATRVRNLFPISTPRALDLSINPVQEAYSGVRAWLWRCTSPWRRRLEA